MRYPLCDEAGLIFETDGKIVLNEDKLFRQLTYQEVLDLEMLSCTACKSIDRGKVDIGIVEIFLEGRAARA